MDRLASLGETLSSMTIYDVKSMYNQAKNMVLNVSEMEAKVQEATNDEPWGASSTLMQEIAQGTFNFQQFNEIMPSIYARFMEKEARQWREIYKALQLLEYLIKNGSERVVDDARGHVSTVKMLRNFHYIDDKGKDQGINVRNRAKEIVELLADVERIRAERRKAKANRTKYIGTGNDGGMSFSSGGGRYGGFGSDSLSGSGSGSYGGGGGYDRDYGGYGNGGGGSNGGFRDTAGKNSFEEYDAGDDETVSRPAASSSSTGRRTTAASSSSRTAQPPPAPKQKAPEKVVDLLGFGDDDPFGSSSAPAPASTSSGVNKALPALGAQAPAPAPVVSLDDDDFGDFQTTPASPAATTTTTATQIPAVQPQVLGHQPKLSLHDMLAAQPARGAQQQQQSFTASAQSPPAYQQQGFGGFAQQQAPPAMNRQSMSYGGMGMGMGMASAPISPLSMGGQMRSPSATQARPGSTPAAAAAATTTKSAGGFDDLFSMALGSSMGSSASSKPATPGAGKSIKDLEREKANAAIWGSGGGSGGVPKPAAMGGGFGGAPLGGSSSMGGGDDLLL